jgi:hypothetical protein
MAAWMAVTVVAAGSPPADRSPLTVAEFAAVLTNISSDGESVGAEQASKALQNLGVPLGNPSAPLTEGRLAAIMEFYGFRTTTSNPSALVSAERGGAAASILLSAMVFAGGTEKRKQGPPVTGDISVCLSERNRGQCVNCCKDLGSPANACAHFCQDLEPPSLTAPR